MVSKSPTRRTTRNRSKSPGRPARKRSVSRGRTRQTRSKTPDPVKIRTASNVEEKPKTRIEDKEPEKPAMEEPLKKEVGAGDTTDSHQEEMTTRLRSLRSSSSQNESVPYKYTSNNSSAKLSEMQPEDKILKPESLRAEIHSIVKSKTDKVEVTTTKFATVEALFGIICLTAVTFGINIMCRKKSCTVMALPSIPKKWGFYFDVQASLVYLGFFFLQAILAAIPVGYTYIGQNTRMGRFKYRCNGFLALVITLTILAAAVYFKLPWSIVYSNFFALLVTSAITSFVFSIFLFVKSRYAPVAALNSNTTSTNYFYDWYEGRELNPRVGSVDMKLLVARNGIVGSVVMTLCLVFYALESKPPEQYSPTLLTCAGLVIWYLLDFLWHEDNYLTTIDILQEGCGFKFVMFIMTYVQFVSCLVVRFLVMYKVELPWYYLVGICILFLTGYIIFRTSNNMKNEFRKNPYSTQFDRCEQICTSRGKKLLVSGWWGRLRHPNYLGDLIMILAISFTCGFQYIIPYYYPVFLLIFLVHRALRDDQLCHRKYGSAWEQYCGRVKYRIFPKVF